MIATAKAGKEDGFWLHGGSVIVAPTGEIVAKGTTEQDEVISYDCDLALGEYIRNTLTKGAPTSFLYGLGAWTPLSGVWNASSGPFVVTPISNTTLSAQGTTNLDLAGNFNDTNIQNSLVRFDTSAGPVFVQLDDQQQLGEPSADRSVASAAALP